MKIKSLSRIISMIAAGMLLLSAPTQAQTSLKKGEYVFRATGGCSCHTVPESTEEIMAGGRGFKTPFGTIYSTNITPDKKTGIGSWSEQNFIDAMRKGIRPNGEHLFPVFPYTSFTKMTDQDLKDLWAYLSSYRPVEKENLEIDMPIPFRWRMGMLFWKFVFFKEGVYQPDSSKSQSWNRGAYLTTGLAHCHECHTPRNIGGGLKNDKLFIGSVDGPEGEFAPNITPDERTGIGDWSEDDLTWFLTSGLKPDGDSIQGLMMEVIEEGYLHLNTEDLNAIAEYIFSLEPVVSDIAPK